MYSKIKTELNTLQLDLHLSNCYMVSDEMEFGILQA